MIHELTARLGDPVLALGGKEVRWNCPFCMESKGRDDTKYHFYANPSKGVFICHRCSAAGTLQWLAQKLGIAPPDEGPDLAQWGTAIRKLYSDEPIEDPDDFVRHVDLPAHQEIKPNYAAYDYITEVRGFKPSVIDEYELSLGSGKYAWRFFIPTLGGSGRVLYWVARTYREGVEPKYINPPKAPRRFHLFNLQRARDYDDCVICEGPLSAMAAGPNAIATFGKHMAKEQRRKLIRVGFKRINIAYDGDATVAAWDLAHTLASEGARGVRVVELPPNHDPASLPRRKFKRLVREATPFTWAGRVQRALEV